MKNENMIYNMICLARYTLIMSAEDSDSTIGFCRK